jgi:hypothetical protein
MSGVRLLSLPVMDGRAACSRNVASMPAAQHMAGMAIPLHFVVRP